MQIQINFNEISVSLKREHLVGEIQQVKFPKWFFWLYLIAPILSLASWIFYYYNGLTLAYNDARSHLDVARRVVDSLTPGFAQIGSVWLPLQHILELITIWNDFMFRTGLSGSVISMGAYIGSAVFILKLSKLLSFNNLAIITAFLVFILNPNLLFLQSIPMTESLLLFTILGSVYFFASWVKTDKISGLILCGLFTFLSVLTRYDGWAMLLFFSIAIPTVSLMRSSKRKAEGSFIVFATLGFFAIFLWLGWNLIIFGDPLFFMNSQYSAKAQQDILLGKGLLFTKYDLVYSTKVYILSVIANSGMAVTLIGFLGVSKAIFSNNKIVTKILIITFLIPVAFNIISLYIGQSVIHLPELPPYTWFNIRYGIMALPAIAIGAGYFVNKRALAAILVTVVVFFQYGSMYFTNNIITVQDGVRGSSGDFLDDVGKWVNTNASEGLILVPASSHDALIFISGLPLDHFITEGTDKYWKESLIDPTKYADFVIMHEGDLAYVKLHNNRNFTQNYSLVYHGQLSDVYKKNKK